MRVLVTYATKYGGTKGIAERIGARLKGDGIETVVASVDAVPSLDAYDAFVIGSAVYMFHWLKPASDFVHRHRDRLGTRPLWLFSSGPLGSELKDAQGRDVRDAARPKEVEALAKMLHARKHQVFFGVFDHSKLGFTDRMVFSMPALRKLMQDGDYRDWKEIDAWADGIAAALATVPVS